MPEKCILVVDDNEEIRNLLGSYLGQHGYRVCLAEDGRQMRDRLNRENVDLIVLDVMMPGEDGLSLCQYVNQSHGPPIVMLTAMTEDADCVVGLEVGADDYVTKPFSPRVLLARIKAVLRRREKGEQIQPQQSSKETEVQFKGWILDLNQYQITRDDGLVVPLSQSEFNLLQVFLAHPQQVLSRDQLLTLTKGREAHPFDRSIDNQVSRLRKKIEPDLHNPTLIKTVWGGGYMFTEKVIR